MAKEIRYTGSFKAVDKDGITYIINIFTEIIDAGTLTETGAEIEGLKQLETDKGEAVNYISKGKYQIVQSGMVLHSNDTEAP